jgi:CelD/BcsL family acetyltransferase involved in cellulose biosynthesis
MDGTGPMPALLAEAFTAAGCETSCTETLRAPYLTLPADWESYLKGLPSRKRRYLTHALRDFDAWAAGTAELCRAATPAELAEGKRILAELHGRRWSEAGQPGVFAQPRFAAFHDALMPQLLSAGALELLWLRVRGEPVAAQYNLVWDGKVSFYQCGRRPDVPDGQRPGVVLMAHAIRGAIETGRREFDFLGEATNYKMQFTRTMRPLVQFRAVRPCLREHARRLAERGLGWARAVRRWLRRGVKQTEHLR